MFGSSEEGFPPLEDLYVPPVEVGPEAAVGPARKAREGWIDGKFLRGPIPVNWLGRASTLSGKALATALAIWFLSGLRYGRMNGLKLTSKTLSLFHVNRSAKSRALKALEEAGLIRVERSARRNPVVTILGAGPDQ